MIKKQGGVGEVRPEAVCEYAGDSYRLLLRLPRRPSFFHLAIDLLGLKRPWSSQLLWE